MIRLLPVGILLWLTFSLISGCAFNKRPSLVLDTSPIKPPSATPPWSPANLFKQEESTPSAAVSGFSAASIQSATIRVPSDD